MEKINEILVILTGRKYHCFLIFIYTSYLCKIWDILLNFYLLKYINYRYSISFIYRERNFHTESGDSSLRHLKEFNYILKSYTFTCY